MPRLSELFQRSAFRSGADRSLELASAESELPAWVTVDEEAGTTTWAAPAGSDKTVIIVGEIGEQSDVFVITDITNPTGIRLGIAPDGYIAAAGIDASGNYHDVLVKAVTTSERTQDIVQAYCGDTGGSGMRVDHAGNLIWRDVTGATCFKIDVATGTVHIKAGGSVVADL